MRDHGGVGATIEVDQRNGEVQRTRRPPHVMGRVRLQDVGTADVDRFAGSATHDHARASPTGIRQIFRQSAITIKQTTGKMCRLATKRYGVA
jgi:hypothetical protein